MALPVPAQSPGDKNVLEVLEDNNKYLEEIKATVTTDSTIIEGQYEILQDQLEIEEENQRLAALEADNAELRANRLERRLTGDTGATATPVSTMSGGAARADGPGLLNALKTAFPLALAPALAAALQGGGLIGLGNMFGESIGSFLGDNIGKLITDLGVDPAFGQKVDDLLTERTGSLIVSGGWSKLLFGKARYGIIADAIAGFLGLPSLTDPAVVEEIQSNITSMFGETVGNLFGGAADVIEQGGQGLFAGSMLGSMFGRKGRVVGALAGLFIDYFDLTSLADPAKRDEIMSNVFDAIPSMLGIGAAVVGGRAALGAAGRAAGRGLDAARGAAGRAFSGAASAVSSRVSSLFGRDGGTGARATPTTTVGGTSYEIGSRPTTRTVQTGFGARTITSGGGAQLTGDALKAAEAKAVASFPRLAKLLKFPGIGSIISLGELFIILNDDSLSLNEKASRFAGLLGGIGGSTLGAIAGTAVGAPGGPLAIATGFLGGTVGYFAGDALVYHIVKYILGMVNTELPEGLVDTIAPEMPEPPALTPTGGAMATGQPGAAATPTSTATGDTVNTTTANMAAQGATELSALTPTGGAPAAPTSTATGGTVNTTTANMVAQGATEQSTANRVGQGATELSTLTTIGRPGAAATPTSTATATGDTVNTTTANRVGQGATELSTLTTTGGATATPTSTTLGGTVNTTTANMVGQGATEQSTANLPGTGNIESSMTNVPGAGNIESSRANTIRTTSVSIASPNSVRILPQVGANQITERSLMLSRQSGNLNIVQPVQNVTNVTNNNTSVAGGGGGGGNVPSGRSYNLDQSFNSVQRPAYA